MINALFSSKPGGSKLFERAEKSALGWETINSLYEQELKRVGQGQTRIVPCLKEAHCLRDAWTKLNVHPAKIMQVRLTRQVSCKMNCQQQILQMCLFNYLLFACLLYFFLCNGTSTVSSN